MPEHEDSSELADQFNAFFRQKIDVIRETFDNSKPNFENELHALWVECLLLDFVTLEKRLGSNPNKSTPQDIIPTSVLKYIVKTFPAMFTDAINCVLCSSVFPDELKDGMVMPLYKKVTSTSWKIIEQWQTFAPWQNLSKKLCLVKWKAICRKMAFGQSNNQPTGEFIRLKPHWFSA